MMERDAAVSEFNKLMKNNKKADLAMIALNEERVANMWRDTAQMNDERIHQLEQDNLRLQEELNTSHEIRDVLEVSNTAIVDILKKDIKGLQEKLDAAKRSVTNLTIEKEAITDTLIGHRDSYIKVFDQLEKYHTGVLLHTDGTVNGTTFMVDGKIPHKMATARIKANIKMGVQASYEVMDTDRAERKWIYGEMSDVNMAYEKRRQTHKEYREDRVKAMILEAAAHNNRTAPKLPKKLPEVNKWECPSCWAPNYLNETIFKKDRMKCGTCFQWTKAVEVKS
jgi:rubrerythrin